MSMAGKVLTVLIVLPAALWIWLASGIAELNRNYGQTLDRLARGIEDDRQALATTVEEVAKIKAAIDLIQRQRDQEMTVRRSQMAQLFEAESESKETLDRYVEQLKSVTASAEGAARRAARAERDLSEVTVELASAQADLAELKAANARDRQTLDEMWAQFTQLLAENSEMADKALRTEQASSTPPGAASLSR